MSDLGDKFDRFETLANKLLEAQPQGNSNTQQIHVSAGGIGLWIAVTCCIVMMVIGFAGGFLFVAEDRKVDRIQDYLNAVYKAQNQPKETTDVQPDHHHS